VAGARGVFERFVTALSRLAADNFQDPGQLLLTALHYKHSLYLLRVRVPTFGLAGIRGLDRSHEGNPLETLARLERYRGTS